MESREREKDRKGVSKKRERQREREQEASFPPSSWKLVSSLDADKPVERIMPRRGMGRMAINK